MDDAVLQDAAAVRVAVRVRPLITRELLQGSKTCISTDGPCVTIGRDRRFTFDHAFGPSTQQEQVYQEVVSPLVESCFDGFNVTVLAYGQTGSGKTFTMGTGECGSGSGEEQQQQQRMGIAPRVIRHVFEGIEARRHQASFQVRAQFLEIYNEDVKDLLVPPTEQTTKWISRDTAPSAPLSSGSGGGITLRDAGDGTILVVGAMEEAAQCAEDLAELLERGMALRATSSTCANEQSSRSHAILTIIIEQHLHPSAQGGALQLDGALEGGASAASSTGGAAAEQARISTDGAGNDGGGGPTAEIRTAKLHLVDLAGSERTKQLRTSMQGPRFRETVNINQGLLALGNVISALGDERRRGSHVPYRESKLTRLLQDSLGGNSRTAMIACVSPADDVLEETLNTLKYANRAKNIRNKPVVNRAVPGVSPLRGVVQQMQLQVLQQLAAQLPDGLPLARGLPLAELLALDATDPAACLDVLGRMKNALAVSGASSRAASMDGSQFTGMLGRQLLGPGLNSPRSKLACASSGGDGSGDGFGGAGPAAEVQALVSGCSRAIAGILHGLAEMEAQGQINREARDHILRSLDASTLRLLPVVRSIGPRSSMAPSPATPQQTTAAAAAGGMPLAWEQEWGARGHEPSRGGVLSAEAAGPAASERERELEDRIRCLESELSGCRAELREAQEDLERDEIIFAEKMKELQEAQAAGVDLRQRLQDADELHVREVEDLRRQVEALQAAASEAQQLAGRHAGWCPARTASRSRLRRGSASGSGCSGYLPSRRRSPSVPFTTLRVVAADGDGSAAAVGADEGCTSGGGGGVESAVSRSGDGGTSGCGGGGGSEDGDGERGGEEDEVLYDEELLSYISETDYTEQHQREVLESDAALREELAEVLREKAAAEADRAALERAAVAQRSSFDEARAALEQQLSWLSGNISVQQQQLQAAQAAEREARELAAKWQERARELETAIEAREEALQRLRSELEAVEGNAVRSVEERAALRQQYEQRIAAVVAQVSLLQRQLHQHASAVATSDRRERQQSAERAAALEAELTRMRTQQADLKRQLSERVSRYERESAARIKELAALRKAAASARSRMAALEQENRAQRLLLRAKQQEVLAAEQRLRDSQRGGGGGTRSRSSSPGSRGYLGRGPEPTDGTRSATAGSRSAPASATTARTKSPSPGRQGATDAGQGQKRSQRPWGGVRSASLQQLEDIAAEELLPMRGGGGGANTGNGNNRVSPPSARPSRQELKQEAAAAVQPGPEEQAEVSNWAEQLLGLVAEAASVEARVEVLASRHQELISRRDLLLQEQSQFGLRTRRRAEQLAQAVAACEAELANLSARAAAASSATPFTHDEKSCTPRLLGATGGQEQTAALDASAQEQQQQEGVEGHLAALQHRMEEVGRARDVLQERASSGRLLDDREQQILDSLDDQLDDLETQLSYVTGELADRRAALAQLQRRREQLQQRAGEVGAAGLCLALTAATEAVGHRAYQVRQLEAALAASEAGAARREAALQYRLRESLVSLSAHIASLEATSPGSSVCLDSSELRNLLGIYLDRDLERERERDRDREREQPIHVLPGSGGPGSAHKAAQQQSQPSSVTHAATAASQQDRSQAAQLAGGAGTKIKRAAGSGAVGSGTGDSGSEGEEPQTRGQHQQQAVPDQLELPQAESLAVWSGNRLFAEGHGSARRASIHADPHLQHQHQVGSTAMGGSAWEGPELSLRPESPRQTDATEDRPLRRAHSPAWPPRNVTLAHGQAHNSSNSSNGGASTQTTNAPRDGERAGIATVENMATPAKAVHGGQLQPRSQHHRTGSGSGLGSQGGVAPASPSAGILRRAGSMDSVGSSGLNSGTIKRVTWSEHIATDPAVGPQPSPTRSAASGGVGGGVLGFSLGGGGAGAPGAGGAGRGNKERSILDRAGSFRAAMTVAARRDSGNGAVVATGAIGTLGTAEAAEERVLADHRLVRQERYSTHAEGTLSGGFPRAEDPGNAAAALGGDGGVTVDATAVRGSDGGGDGGRSNGSSDFMTNGRTAAPPIHVPRPSSTPMSRSSDASDDIVAAADAGAAAPAVAAISAPEEAGIKGGVRSFNPWRSSGGGAGGPPTKQLRMARELHGPQAEQQHEQQLLQSDILRISFETNEGMQDPASSSKPSPRRSGGGDMGVEALKPSQRGLEDVLRAVEGGGGGGGARPPDNDARGRLAGAEEQVQLQPPRPGSPQQRWQSREGRAAALPPFDAFLGNFGGSGSVVGAVREHRPDVPTSGPPATVAGAVCYELDDDELEEHVRLLERAASAAAAAPSPPLRHRAAPPSHPAQGPTSATERCGWGAGADGRQVAVAAAGAFGYAVVFDHDSDSDSDVYCVSPGPTPGPTPRELLAAAKVVGSQAQSRSRGRFSLDKPHPAAAVAASTGASGNNGGSKGPSARANNSAPLPLPAPVRSISPMQHHYSRLQRLKPCPAPGPSPAPAPAPAPAPPPGPFTTPKPIGAMAALSEALLPYKAHLKRSAGGSGAGAATSRADTPEGRRGGGGAGSGVKANFANPQHQQQRYLASGAWPLGSGDSGAAAAAAYRAPQQRRAAETAHGAGGGVMEGPPYAARQGPEDRQAAVAAAILRSAGRNARLAQ